MICEICDLLIEPVYEKNHLRCHFANGEAVQRITADGRVEYYKAAPVVVNQSWLRAACDDVGLDWFLVL